MVNGEEPVGDCGLSLSYRNEFFVTIVRLASIMILVSIHLILIITIVMLKWFQLKPHEHLLLIPICCMLQWCTMRMRCVSTRWLEAVALVSRNVIELLIDDACLERERKIRRIFKNLYMKKTGNVQYPHLLVTGPEVLLVNHGVQ